MAKEYCLSNINRNIKKVKQAANKKLLRDKGRANFDLIKIHNVEAKQRCQNPDIQIAGARIKLKKQLEECLIILKAIPTE